MKSPHSYNAYPKRGAKVSLSINYASIVFGGWLILYSCGSFAFTSSVISNDQPNIILIMADDMGYECLSSNGSLSYTTPELDKLATNGIRFTQCHSQPLCTPSRVKIMTGRYNSHNYIDFGYLDVKEKTFGNMLKNAGYKTMVAGKWQLNGVNTNEEGCMDQDRPYQFGFDEYCLWWLTKKGSRYANPRIVQNGELLQTTIDDYGPDIVSDYITGFIERNQKNPFFVYYPMMLVHSPFQPTPDSPEWKMEGKRTEIDKKYFKDMVEYTDKVVAKIINKLDKLNLTDNTMVIFVGDNGTNSDIITQTKKGPYRGGKGHLQDNGTHVPMIVGWPAGGKKNFTSSDLVEFSDFVPTFADAANEALPENIDGRSFLNLLTNKPYSPRETIFIHYYPTTTKASDRNGCFVRTTRFKLYSDGRFYDLETDKWEETELNTTSLTGSQKKIFTQLESELKNKLIWDFTIPRRE
jgi:arylsulfatase A